MPEPCECGSAIFWRKGRVFTCAGCDEKPEGALKAILVTEDGVNRWSDYSLELAAVRRKAGEVLVKDDWIQRPDVNGVMGWERKGLSAKERWWAKKTFEELPGGKK